MRTIRRGVRAHRTIGWLPVLLVGTAAHAALPAAEAWLELDTPHFAVLSQADEEETRQIALNLEAFYQALPAIAPELAPKATLPSFVFAFRDEAHFAPYKGEPYEALGARLGGVFYATPDANYIAIKAGLAGRRYAVVYHEFIHDVATQNYPRLPVWLNEGLADYYSTFWFQGSDVQVGRVVAGHLAALAEKHPLPLQTLFNVKHGSPEYFSPLAVERIYPTSWLLVHYLMHAGPAQRAKLDRYLAARKAGQDDATAHVAAFGLDYRELEQALARYLAEQNFPVVSRTLPEFHVELTGTVRPASRSRLLAQLGCLLAAQNRVAAAEEHLVAALEAGATDPQPVAALAFLRQVEGRFDDSARLFEEAVSKGADDPITLFRAARSLLFQAQGPNEKFLKLTEAPPEGVLRARAWLERGLARAPDSPEAHADLGRTYLYATGDHAPGIAALEKARELRPVQPDLAWNLARLYLLHDDREKAQALIEGPIATLFTVEEVNRLREDLLQSDLAAASNLVTSGQVEAGLERYRQLLAQAPKPLHDRITAEIARIDGVAARNREVEAYNAAIALVQKGDPAAAIAALEKLSASCKDPDVCREAQATLEKLLEMRGGR